MDKLFTMTEAATILSGIYKVTEQEIRRKMSVGEIARRKVGKRWFVADDTLYSLIIAKLRTHR
jgi:hypothetical protein